MKPLTRQIMRMMVTSSGAFKTLTFNHTLLSADATLVPVSVQLNSSNFDFSLCDVNGNSIKFTDSTGNPLFFSKRRFDSVNQLAGFMVLMPAISASADTTARIYYGLETARHELFADASLVESTTLTRSINRPTKYASNPVFGNVSWTWDKRIAYFAPLTDPSWPTESRVRAIYCALDAAANFCTCYAYSADGETWVRPNLGIVSYGGNTDNNILALGTGDYANGQLAAGAKYNPTTDTYYVTSSGEKFGASSSSTNKLFISVGDPTGPYTLAKTLPYWSDNSNHPGHGMGVDFMPDGRFIVYYQHWNPTISARSLGAFVSNTTDPTGDWTDIGLIQTGLAAVSDQYHGDGQITYDGGNHFLAVDNYADTGTIYGPIRLTASRNLTSLQNLDNTWIGFGASGAWDDTQALAGGGCRVGNQWKFYYYGAKDATLATESYTGLASIAYGRIVQYTQTAVATGTLVTKKITVGTAGLHVNAAATGAGDKIEVALLNAATDAVITGFAHTDCTDFTGDSSDTEIMWGANGLADCGVTTVKIKFYVTKAASDTKLFSYWVGEEVDTTKDKSCPTGVYGNEPVTTWVSEMGDNQDGTATVKCARIASSGINQVLYVTGAKTGAGQPVQIATAHGAAQRFDGSDDTILIDNGTKTLGSLGSEEFTIITHVAAPTEGNVYTLTKYGTSGFYCGHYAALGRAVMATSNGGVFKNLDASGLTFGPGWRVSAMVKTGTTGDLWFEGQKRITGADLNHSITGSSALRIGSLVVGGTTYYSQVDIGFVMLTAGTAKPDAYIEALSHSFANNLISVT